MIHVFINWYDHAGPAQRGNTWLIERQADSLPRNQDLVGSPLTRPLCHAIRVSATCLRKFTSRLKTDISGSESNGWCCYTLPLFGC